MPALTRPTQKGRGAGCLPIMNHKQPLYRTKQKIRNWIDKHEYDIGAVCCIGLMLSSWVMAGH